MSDNMSQNRNTYTNDIRYEILVKFTGEDNFDNSVADHKKDVHIERNLQWYNSIVDEVGAFIVNLKPGMGMENAKIELFTIDHSSERGTSERIIKSDDNTWPQYGSLLLAKCEPAVICIGCKQTTSDPSTCASCRQPVHKLGECAYVTDRSDGVMCQPCGKINDDFQTSKSSFSPGPSQRSSSPIAGPVRKRRLGENQKGNIAIWNEEQQQNPSCSKCECSNAVVKSLFPNGAKDIRWVTKRPPTAGALFKTSMCSLVANLASKIPYYVRCVKPNEIKSSHEFNVERVQHQILYLGLLENVRVRRAGFAYRMSYDRFMLRYKMLCRVTWPNFKRGTLIQDVKVILNETGHIDDVVFGKDRCSFVVQRQCSILSN